MEIKLEKVNEKKYIVLTSSGLFIGTFELDVDGFYYYWENLNLSGSWSAYQLRVIADKLDEINKPFKEVVDEYFDQERRNFEERARVEYRKLLNESGMFFVFYPQLTGNYKKDKEQWLVEYKKLENLRAENNAF